MPLVITLEWHLSDDDFWLYTIGGAGLGWGWVDGLDGEGVQLSRSKLLQYPIHVVLLFRIRISSASGEKLEYNTHSQ